MIDFFEQCDGVQSTAHFNSYSKIWKLHILMMIFILVVVFVNERRSKINLHYLNSIQKKLCIQSFNELKILKLCQCSCDYI